MLQCGANYVAIGDKVCCMGGQGRSLTVEIAVFHEISSSKYRNLSVSCLFF